MFDADNQASVRSARFSNSESETSPNVFGTRYVAQEIEVGGGCEMRLERACAVEDVAAAVVDVRDNSDGPKKAIRRNGRSCGVILFEY